MQIEGISVNEVTYICSLRACGNLGLIQKGREIHGEVYRKKVHNIDERLSNALVDMYAKCGLFSKAHEVFESLGTKSVISWTSLISGYVKHEQSEEALNCFRLMQSQGIPPNVVTYACGLRACGILRDMERGREMHYEVARKGLERDALIGGALLDMYARCGSLTKAQEIFDDLPTRGIVLWTTLISGYVNHGHNEHALTSLELMELEHISPNVATYVSCLKACGNIAAVDKGQEIHGEIARKDSVLGRDQLLIGNALVHMYVKSGMLAKAEEVFNNLSTRDIISWTTLIAGYAEQGQGEEALHYFEQMGSDGFPASAATIVCTLKACSNIGAVVKGRSIHIDIMRKGLELNLIVASTLVDMYSKCGLLPIAQRVFDKLSSRDVVLWNSLIAGYVQVGQTSTVFTLFHRMTQEGKRPDVITFTSLLNVCSQAGLVNQGLTYFEAMSEEYGILPTFEHHGCMVDLLGRVGELMKAVGIMERMPSRPNLVLLRTMLTSCEKLGNAELGREAFSHVLAL
jgi:pentatricopeptide repeat protein